MPTRPKVFNPARDSGIKQFVGAETAERKRFYNSARWRRLRLAILAENPVCADCLARGDATIATTVHHVEERLQRPDLDLDRANMMALCGSCHSKRHKGMG